MIVLHALLVAFALGAQDPKPAPKTVEDRLKELEEKLSSLEKKKAALNNDNATMEKTIADLKATREQYARQAAAGWVQQYAKAAQFTEKQCADLEKLWLGWMKEDLDKRADLPVWKAREDAIRNELTSEQIPLLARKVRDDQETGVNRTVSFLTRRAKLDPEKTAAFEKAVLGKIDFEEGALLLQAHPEKVTQWTAVPVAAEAVLPQFTSTLSEEEMKLLRQVLEQWKPKQR
jgi:hypothetical protein